MPWSLHYGVQKTHASGRDDSVRRCGKGRGSPVGMTEKEGRLRRTLHNKSPGQVAAHLVGGEGEARLVGS